MSISISASRIWSASASSPYISFNKTPVYNYTIRKWYSIPEHQTKPSSYRFLPIFTGGRKENGNGPSLSASKDSIGQSVKNISNPFLMRWAAITPNNKLIKITTKLSIVSSRLNSYPSKVNFDRIFSNNKGINIGPLWKQNVDSINLYNLYGEPKLCVLSLSLNFAPSETLAGFWTPQTTKSSHTPPAPNCFFHMVFFTYEKSRPYKRFIINHKRMKTNLGWIIQFEKEFRNALFTFSKICF